MIKKKWTLRILDEVNVVFLGLEEYDLSYLIDKYSLFVNGYKYMTKYQLGIWDGRIQFFKRTGKTYLELVPEIMGYLEKRGYSLSHFNLVDKRNKFNVELPVIKDDYLIDNGITLGKHQLDAINALTQSHGGIFVGGTGAGKTICAAALAKLYYEKLKLSTIIIVPTSDLIDQTIEEIEQFIPVGEYSGSNKSIDFPCVVSTWQALQNNKAILSKFQVAIVDECHGVKGDVLRNMLNDHGSNMCVKIGVTGTLPNNDIDAMCVRITLGDAVHKTTAAELIRNGWLATPTLEIHQLEENFTEEYQEYCETSKDRPQLTYAKFKQEIIPDYISEKKHLQNNTKRNTFISEAIIKLRTKKKGNTFILINGILYGKKLAKLIPNAHFVYGKDEKKARKEIYDLFSDNDDIVVISTFQLASTGLNIKRIFNLIFIDAGQSYIQIIQSIGRGLRKAHDKDTVYILDVCGDLKYGRRHLSERTKHYRQEEYEYSKKKIDYFDNI